MEQILYLIFGAAWLAFNFYKKSQEAKASKEAERAYNEGRKAEPVIDRQKTLEVPKSFEEMVLEQFGEKRQEQKAPATVLMPVAPRPFLSADAPKYAEGQRPRVERRSQKTQDEVRPKVFYSDLMKEDLDMRKALIYNTILQRPYA